MPSKDEIQNGAIATMESEATAVNGQPIVLDAGKSWGVAQLSLGFLHFCCSGF